MTKAEYKEAFDTIQFSEDFQERTICMLQKHISPKDKAPAQKCPEEKSHP